MNLNRIKGISQSKYFKPILKTIILLWFFYAVYDIFFKNSSDSSNTRENYITNNPNTSIIDSSASINNSNNSNLTSNKNSNTNKTGNNILYNYTVSKSDNIGIIATRFKTSKDKLKQINNLKSDQLKSGTVIKIPVKSIHIVKNGETLYSIAVKYGTTRKILKDVNKLSSDTDIKAGQNICIPLL